MQPEGSLLCSQETAICPYPEPYQSSPRPPPQMISLTSFSILSSHLRLCLPKWSLSLRFTHQTPVRTYPLPHTWHISSPCHFFFIWSPGYLLNSKNQDALQSAIPSVPYYLVPLRPIYPLLSTTSAYFYVYWTVHHLDNWRIKSN